MKILDQTPPLQFTIDPKTVYISTDSNLFSYANFTVTVNNVSGDTVSVNSFAITLPPDLAPVSSLSSITPVADTPSIWLFASSDITLGKFDATPQSGNDVPMKSTDTWKFSLNMVTLNSTANLPTPADIRATVTYGNGSTFTQPLKVLMDAATQSIVYFNSQPSGISPGGSAMLSWQCTGIDYCILSPGDGSNLNASGSQEMSPQETTIYTLYAYTDSVILSAQWAISVENPQVIKFGGQDGQTNLNLGDSITLVWECNQYTNDIKLNASTDVDIPNLYTGGNTVTKGSVVVGPVNAPTSFTFTAIGTNVQNFNESGAMININDVTASLTATPDINIWEKDDVTLKWDIQSASAVNITPALQNGPSLSNLSGSVIINPTENITYTLEAVGFINNLPNTASTPLSLNIEQVQINSFTINPPQITPNIGTNSATLEWTTQAQVLVLNNGIGDVSGSTSYLLNTPVDGTVYTLSAGTTQNPGLITASVPVINSFGPYTFDQFSPDPMWIYGLRIAVPDPGSMIYLKQGYSNFYTLTLTGVDITSSGGDTSLIAMSIYIDDNPAQSYFLLIYWPLNYTTPVTMNWANENNPTGTITLTGVYPLDESLTKIYNTLSKR